MTDTNQLPPHTITINDHPEPHIMQWSDLELAAIKKYAESYALQAIAQATQAEVTDEQIIAAYLAWCKTSGTPESFARAILALRPVQSGLTGCNCRWDGDTQVQWCELHLAHKEAIHEWAERAKEAEKQLALRPAAVPMTCHCQTCRPITITDMRMVRCPKCGNKRCPHANDHRNACTGSNEPGQPGSAYPAHHGITAQAKKETP